MAGGIRHSKDDDLPENHEINVTPFIDVMLVLLIIFMVAAPLATVDINVDLPSTNAPPQERPQEPVFLTIKADLTLVVDSQPASLETLPAALDLATEGDPERRIHLRADKTVDYDVLMQTMNVMRAAGYLKVALVGLEDGE